MYKVRATDTFDWPRLFACGTTDQVLDRLDEMDRWSFKAVVVVEPDGRERSPAEFRREHGD